MREETPQTTQSNQVQITDEHDKHAILIQNSRRQEAGKLLLALELEQVILLVPVLP